MAEQHGHEVRVAPGSEHSNAVADRPDRNADQPLLQAQADRGGDRAIDDRNAARRTTEQDRLSQAGVDRRLEASNMTVVDVAHATSAPPPKLKKDRKKLEAANAIDRPKMIWMSLRNPPEIGRAHV